MSSLPRTRRRGKAQRPSRQAHQSEILAALRRNGGSASVPTLLSDTRIPRSSLYRTIKYMEGIVTLKAGLIWLVTEITQPPPPIIPISSSQPPPPIIPISSSRYVYFIRDLYTLDIKIGQANDPLRRLSSLQTGNPRPLALLGVIPTDRVTEVVLHQVFAHLAIPGKATEWFRPGKDLLAYIECNASLMLTSEGGVP